MGIERKTLVVGNSWHAKWYRFWEKLGGEAPARENLCHYFWTCVLYAPIRAFLLWAPKRAPWITPAVGVGLAILATAPWTAEVGIIWGLYFVIMGFMWRSMVLKEFPAWADRLDAFLQRHSRVFGWGFLAVVAAGVVTSLVLWTGTTLLVLGAAIGLVLVVLAFGFGCAWISDWRKSRKAFKPEKGDSALAVVKGFAHAKHYKMCPFIEFADEKVTV